MVPTTCCARSLLDEHLQRGMLFPRWAPELVLGYGYPVLNFYGPAAYYLAEAWHLLGLGYYRRLWRPSAS